MQFSTVLKCVKEWYQRMIPNPIRTIINIYKKAQGRYVKTMRCQVKTDKIENTLYFILEMSKYIAETP